MKKIAILTCLKANKVCTGAACFKAYNEKKDFFARYQNLPLELVAFAKCNGCQSDLATDRDLQSKLERLIKIGTEVVHLGVCTKNKATGIECAKITAIAERLQQANIEVVRGCHL